MTSTLDIIEDYLHMKQIACVRLDGGMNRVDRAQSIQTFTHHSSRESKTAMESKDSNDGFEEDNIDTRNINMFDNKEVQIFLLSTRAGGLGLNLQVAGNHSIVCHYYCLPLSSWLCH
jgi:SNF2 family DNA or RNA helicase